MKTPLAWLNLLYDKMRTAVAIAGVTFALILILMQLGFYGSVLQSATRVYDRLRFDLLVVSPQYMFFSKSGTFPKPRLYQVQGNPAVESASPLYLGVHLWRNLDTGRRRGMLIMGVDPADGVFDLPEIEANVEKLNVPDNVLVDRLSRSEFGPRDVGLSTEIGGHTIRVVGHFTLGTGFGADGAILTSDRTFARILPFRSSQQVSLGLVRLKSGSNPDEVARELRERLPPDVRVMTRAEVRAHEQHHWVVKTSVGIIFGLGVVVAVLVGTAIVYQVLSSDIANRLPEYATLKAMGYGPRYLSSVVLQQAWILAVAGFLPSFLISVALYGMTERLANIPMNMTTPRAVGVLLTSVAMCSISAMLSLRKVNTADPADLF